MTSTCNTFTAFKQITLLVLFTLLTLSSFATHYRAGEILYEQITERRYKITVITYTDPRSLADPSTVEVNVSFGDGTSQTVQRSSRTFMSSIIVQNVYTTTHEYRIDGSYIISIIDQNRVNGIVNINLGNTEFIAFYVESLLKINQSIGPNRSPILTKPPIDNGCRERVYYHNPAAYDPDGDSLTFELTTPKQGVGQVVPNYEDPMAKNNFFKIDLYTGQLKWDAPITSGIYNIAILIKEFRKNILVGYVVRDMQIFIGDCVNRPPLVQDINNGCVVVGDTIQRIISAADSDNFQNVMLNGFGGAFAVDRKATFSPNPAVGLGAVNTRFTWAPTCNQIRKSPWQVIFEAKDDATGQPAVSQNSFFVNVIGPPLLNLKSNQVNNGFQLTWNKDTCQLASRYKVYRRIDSSRWNPGECETGIPASTGFQLIATINTLNSPTANSYYDDNQGKGLSPLVVYCYRVVSVYPNRSALGQVIYGDETESIASDEICDNMILTNPTLTQISVAATATSAGKIDVKLIKPLALDTTVYLPPYQTIVKRNVTGQLTQTNKATYNYATFGAIKNEALTDSLLNTETNQYTYVVDFFAQENGVTKLVGTSSTGTSLRAIIYSTDKTNILSWQVNVPWVNDTFVVFRKNTSNLFDSLGYTTGTSYKDSNLTNNVNYCYVIKSKGFYELLGAYYQTINYSQEICGTPIDTVRPCAPDLLVTPPCALENEFRNELNWYPKQVCAPDVVSYKIYYKQLENDPYILLATVPNNVLKYFDTREILKQSIAGCYHVAGVDSAGNESFNTNEVCIDNCPIYEIPNVFTPNADNVNDTLHPFPYKFVSGIDMVIFNRWGNQVYKTTNIDINWSGNDLETNKTCPDGVYFYICNVKEIYLDGVRTRVLKGTIQIIRN